MNPLIPALFAHAERQRSVFSLDDARRFGLSDSVVWELSRRGLIERVAPRVWRVVGAPASQRQRVTAHALSLGRQALAARSTAAHLLRLDSPLPCGLHFVVDRASSRGRRSAVDLHRVSNLVGADRRVVDGIPCTSAARTVIDLAGDLDDEAFESLAESARRLSLMTLTVLEARVDGIGRFDGIERVRRYVEAHRGQAPLQYRLEVKVRRLLESVAPTGSFRAQRPIVAGGRRYFVDFCCEAARLVVECDGFAWHGDRLQWKRDRRRIAAIEGAGWRVLHVTWDDVVQQPDLTSQRIRDALVGRLPGAA